MSEGKLYRIEKKTLVDGSEAILFVNIEPPPNLNIPFGYFRTENGRIVEFDPLPDDIGVQTKRAKRKCP